MKESGRLEGTASASSQRGIEKAEHREIVGEEVSILEETEHGEVGGDRKRDQAAPPFRIVRLRQPPVAEDGDDHQRQEADVPVTVEGERRARSAPGSARAEAYENSNQAISPQVSTDVPNNIAT